MLNRVILIGRLTRDPELRYTTSGVAVVTFSLAVDRPYMNQQGQREADFIRIKAWRKLAETVANNLGKGRLVAVDGHLEVRSYDAQDGTKRTVSEVIAESVRFLDWPKEGQGSRQNQGGGGDEDPFAGDFSTPSDDDLPF